MEKKLGLFTEEDMKVMTVEVKEEKTNDVSGSNAGAWAASAPFFVGGGAVAAGGFAAASAV